MNHVHDSVGKNDNSKTNKRPRPKKDDSSKVKKLSKGVKLTSTRKINNKPVLSRSMGINISPIMIKNIISNHGLNKKSYNATVEIKNAMPRQLSKTVDGVTTLEEFKGTSIANLSQSTRDHVLFANDMYEKSLLNEYTKNKVANMSVDDKKVYLLEKIKLN